MVFVKLVESGNWEVTNWLS